MIETGGRRLIGPILLVASAVGPTAVGPVARGDDELEAHLARQARRMEDPSRPIAEREQVALELAAMLDRAAWADSAAETRRATWGRAERLLADFSRRNGDHPRSRLFRAQGAVYRWAIGRSWADQFEADPTDDPARAASARAFDEVIARLEPMARDRAEAGGPIGPTVRYRLAQALADRSTLEPEGSARRRALRERALALLAGPVEAPGLDGFAALLRAELLATSGRLEAARAALDEAQRAAEPPAEADRLRVRLDILLAENKYQGALETLERSSLEEPARDLLAVRVRLAERAALPVGRAREAAEADALAHADRLRGRGGPEARLALIRLARAIDEPGPGRDDRAWEMLAEGANLLGDPERASRLAGRGADRAVALGRPDRAAALRLLAGGFLYRSGAFERAETIFSRLAADPTAGPVRARAGMLRALARGRALERGRGAIDRDDYLQALRDQVRDFPDDPATGEARWRLGQALLDDGDPAAAERLWAAIPRGDRRWLDARLAIGEIRRAAVEGAGPDDRARSGRLAAARAYLRGLRAEARDDAERAEVDLSRARLELTPETGSTTEALRIADELLAGPLRDDQRGRVRRVRVVALARAGHYVEAEAAARAAAVSDGAAGLLELARQLDQAASATESDLVRRRFGQLLRIVTDRAIARPGKLAAPGRAEARLLQARGLLFSGDHDAARRALDAWPDADATLGPLDRARRAETLAQAGDFDGAIASYRRLLDRLRPGSGPWFAARYGLAVALERHGQQRQARRIVEATALLHPDLGGPAWRARFEILQRRLAPP